jgi:phage baseplate assembly protein gpV
LSSVFETVRKIAEAEVKKLNVVELGVVTSVFPHSATSDKDNYECNIKLKNRDVELRRVPVATQQKGLVSIPNTGDLVIVTFVRGDVNSPIILGRLYTDDDRPPTSDTGEVVYEPSYSYEQGKRRIHVEFTGGMIFTITDDDLTAKAGKTTIVMKKDGDLSIESEGDISVKAKGTATVSSNGDMSFSAPNIKLDGQQAITIKAGTNADIESSGPMKIKGAVVNIN